MMNQSSAPKPTKLRQAIDRAIARVQAEAAAEQTQPEQRTMPAPPKPLSGAEVIQVSTEQLEPTSGDSPTDSSTKTTEAVQFADESPLSDPAESSSVDDTETTEADSAAQDSVAVWPLPPQEPQPESMVFQRDERYKYATERATQRDRSVFPVIERVLTPISAAELGWQRPQLRRPLRQPVPEQPQLDADQPLAEYIDLDPDDDLAQATEVEPIVAELEIQPVPELVAPSEPAVSTPRKPLAPEVLAALSPEVAPLPEFRRPPMQFAILAGILWAIVLGWLLFGGLGPHSSQTTRWLFGVVTLMLGISTWGPIQWGLRLQALTWRGTVGWMIVFWWLAFVRPPTSSLTSLPDTPLYILFCIGVFMALSAAVMPILYLRRVQRSGSRRERFDVRRTQRQANEVALFVALCIILAAMNVLELVSVILLIMILALSEMLLLSLQRT